MQTWQNQNRSSNVEWVLEVDGEVFVSSRLELIPTSSWREGVGKELREVTRSGGVLGGESGGTWVLHTRLAIFQTRPCDVLHYTLQRRLPLKSCHYVTRPLQELSQLSYHQVKLIASWSH